MTTGELDKLNDSDITNGNIEAPRVVDNTKYPDSNTISNVREVELKLADPGCPDEVTETYATKSSSKSSETSSKQVYTLPACPSSVRPPPHSVTDDEQPIIEEVLPPSDNPSSNTQDESYTEVSQILTANPNSEISREKPLSQDVVSPSDDGQLMCSNHGKIQGEEIGAGETRTSDIVQTLNDVRLAMIQTEGHNNPCERIEQETKSDHVENEHKPKVNHENENESTMAPSNQKKKKKRRRYPCHLCGKEFRKQVHVKIHISRVHMKRQRKVTQYIARKRETILTRSRTHKHKPSEIVRNPVYETSGDFRKISTSGTLADQRDATNIDERAHGNKDSSASLDNHVVNHQSKYQHILPKPYTEPQQSNFLVTDLAISECHVCHYCKRSFRYASWLERHMVIHQTRKISHKSKLKKIGKSPSNPPTQFRLLHSEDEVQEQVAQYMQRQEGTIEAANSKGIPSVKTVNSLSTAEEKRWKFHEYESNAEDCSNKSRTTEDEDKTTKTIPAISCSTCGRHFTTKKNCRRHRRIVHNILVRPERTKLPYANYVVEHEEPSNRKSKTSLKFHVMSTKNFVNDQTAKPDISIRMFDPTKLQGSEIQQRERSKQLKRLQWKTSSNRTGPPPSTTKDPVNSSADGNIHKRFLSQKPLPNTSATLGQWVNARKPEPCIPKTQDRKADDHSNLTKHAKGGSDISVRRMSDKKVKVHPQLKNASAILVDKPTDLSTSVKRTSDWDYTGMDDMQMSNSKRQRLTSQIDDLVKTMDAFKQRPTEKLTQQQNTSLPGYLEVKLVETPSTTKGQIQDAPLERAQQKITVYRPILPKPKPLPIQNVETPTPNANSTLRKIVIDNGVKKVFSCNVCSMIFHGFTELEQHVSLHADDWPYRCEFCIQLFQTPQDLVFHRKNHHLVGKGFTCKTCQCKYGSKKALETHQVDCHGTKSVTVVDSKEKPETPNKSLEVILAPDATCSHPVFQASTTYRCTKCSKQFSETLEFHSHIMDCALKNISA